MDFSDLVFNERGINEPTNMTKLAEFATTAGADTNAFNKCLESGQMTAKVNASYNEAASAGIQGTLSHTSLLAILSYQLKVLNHTQRSNKQLIIS